jgi:hypothetical protein
MGFIREPKGIDFVIDSGVLSDTDRAEISYYIREYRRKAENKKEKSKEPNHSTPLNKQFTKIE